MRLFTTLRRRADRVPSIGGLDLFALAGERSLASDARLERFVAAWSLTLGRAWGVPLRARPARVPPLPGAATGACRFRIRLGGLPIEGSLDGAARRSLVALALGSSAPVALGASPSPLERTLWSRLLLEPAAAAWLRALELPVVPIDASVLSPSDAEPLEAGESLAVELADADGRSLGHVRFGLPQAWWRQATPEGGERLGRLRLGGTEVELVASLLGPVRPIGLRALAGARPGDLLLTDLRIGEGDASTPAGMASLPVRLDPAGGSRSASPSVRPLAEATLGTGRGGAALAVRPLGTSGTSPAVR